MTDSFRYLKMGDILGLTASKTLKLDSDYLNYLEEEARKTHKGNVSAFIRSFLPPAPPRSFETIKEDDNDRKETD